MMRLWAESYTRSAPLVPGATVSIVAHAAVIVSCIIATLPAANVPEDSIANRVFFMPPPDRTGAQRARHETVHFVDVTRPGPGTGDGPRRAGTVVPVTRDETVGRGEPDSVSAPPAPAIVGPPDSVFSILDVDTAVVRSANSAAPAYPLKLLAAHIMGMVAAQYVVDTNGFADTISFRVMNATNPEFIAAVREALPYMRFTPAKIGPLKVRQLVEQQFTFRIADTVVAQRPKKP